MPSYKAKPSFIHEVHQWSPPEEWPLFYPQKDLRPEFGRVTLVDKGHAAVFAGYGRRASRIHDGDYIIPMGDSVYAYAMTPDEFDECYEPL